MTELQHEDLMGKLASQQDQLTELVGAVRDLTKIVSQLVTLLAPQELSVASSELVPVELTPAEKAEAFATKVREARDRAQG